MNTRDLTKAFNKKFQTSKTESTIKSTLQNHKIRCGRKHGERLIIRFQIFTEKQIQFLRDKYKDISTKEMTDRFNKRFKKDKKTFDQIKCALANRGISSGRTGFFPKGKKPWNTGTKGLTCANSGSFKTGQAPPNRKPLGAERICSKDGYILIKVAERDPHTDFPTRWKHKKVHVWEQAHGPVPEGKVVAFIDSVKTNCELDNLMLISRAELLNLNRLGYKDAPAELKPSILALTKLQVKTWEKEKC